MSEVRFLYQREIERPGKRERERGRGGERERWRDEGGSCDIIAKSVRH